MSQNSVILRVRSCARPKLKLRTWSTGEGCLNNRSQRPQPCDLHGEDLERTAKCGTPDLPQGREAPEKSGHLKIRRPDKHTHHFTTSASETVETSSFRLYFRFEVHLVFSTMRYVPAERVFGRGKSRVPGLFTESFAVT